jgi:hypothetical protein
MATSHEHESRNKTPVSTQKAQKGVEPKIVDYTQATAQKLPENQPLTDLVDKTFVIQRVEFYPSKYGEIALVYVNDKAYRTVSEVIIRQLHRLEETLKEGYAIRVKLIKYKRYLTFVKPE